jgi:nicotinamidase-related amidase
MKLLHHNILDPAGTALVVCDIQESFRHVVPDFSDLAARALTAIWGFQALGLPVLITEQYPKGLGRTAEEIVCALPAEFEVFEKTSFSACGSADFLARIVDLGIGQIVLCGLETHICVNQTAHDLLNRGIAVHLLIDCVRSRAGRDTQAGIDKMMLSGVLPASIEMVLFELMADSRHEKFKEIQSLIK